MNRNSFVEYLSAVSALRKHRRKAADLVLEDPTLFPLLIEIAFRVDENISIRASWVLEFVCKDDILHVLPYIDTFLENAPKVHLDSSVRPIAKICELLMEAYFGRKPSEVKKTLTEKDLEHLTALCFDWLINDEKVAAKAYAMRCLFLLGTHFDWIHPELRLILEENYARGSAAYKARARHTFEAIEKFEKKKLRSTTQNN